MNMYFVSGVSGVGKTSVMEILKTDLPEQYLVKDFDERGVPAGGGRPWRLSETQFWILEGNRVAAEGETLIVCGLANPEEIALMHEASEVEVKIILLDAPGEVIRERLLKRNSDEKVRAGLERTVGSVDAFIKGSSYFAPILRGICIDAGIPVVDTSKITKLEQEKERMLTLYRKGLIDDEELQSQLSPLRQALKTSSKKCAALESTVSKEATDNLDADLLNKIVCYAPEAMQNLSFEQKKEIVLDSVSNIVAEPGRLDVTGAIGVERGTLLYDSHRLKSANNKATMTSNYYVYLKTISRNCRPPQCR